ncbi:hypothetical protein EVAR_3421_1 [Eumeta japonica]|uniref:Uncharacterized protein n=1 Tax=Eumeta variegata TaxID=151549 RepID=A0A4C1SV42_EUMVA|nr:hypothetical protein EVAR_3421_1 [Eumeta japonica]
MIKWRGLSGVGSFATAQERLIFHWKAGGGRRAGAMSNEILLPVDPAEESDFRHHSNTVVRLTLAGNTDLIGNRTRDPCRVPQDTGPSELWRVSEDIRTLRWDRRVVSAQGLDPTQALRLLTVRVTAAK